MKTRILLSFLAFALETQAQTAVPGFAGNAQHTGDYLQTAQNLNSVHWSTSVDLSNNGTLIHYGAPAVSAANTVFVPVKTATGQFQVSAFNGASGAPVYTLPTDYILPSHNWIPPYNPALVTGPSGVRLYYAGAGGTAYYIDNPDSAPVAAPVQVAFYGLASYRANPAGFNASVFIDTPITSDNNGNIFFGYRVQGTAPAPLSGTQSGFARIDPSGNATYVPAGIAAGDGNIARDSHNSAPALSNDGSTLYVLAKSADTDSYGYLLGLDSVTLATRYKTILKDPRNGNYATISDDSTASPMVAPDNDVYIGVLGNPEDSHRGFLLHFSGDLSAEKLPGAFGWDSTPAVVPASMLPTSVVPSYTGSSSYLIFSKYNDYAGDDGGEGINRIALLDPNSEQIDPHPSANGLTEMREVLTVSGVTPDAYYVAAGYPMAVSEWCVNTPAVSSATASIYIPSEDGHLYRWDLSTNSLAQTVSLGPGIGQAYVPVVLGPDGTAYTINGGNLFAVGNVSGNGITVTSAVPDLRNAVAGQPLTFIAQVTGAGTPGVIPAGAVTFQNVSFQGATPLSYSLDTVSLDATGKAEITVSGLTAGAHFITATFGSSSSTMVQLIHAEATTIKLASSMNPSRNGRAVAFTATVIPSAPGSGTPTGMVTFTDGGNVLAQLPVSGGVASFATTALAAGVHLIGAVYSSDNVFAASTATLTERADGPHPVPVGREVSVSGTVSSTLRPLALPAGLLSGIGDSSQNPANLTLEGTSDWIHWGDSSLNRKATGGSQLSSFTAIGTTNLLTYSNDPRPLNWTDGNPTVTSTNNPNGVYFPYAGDGFSFTAPADTTVRTLVVHAGGYFSVARLTAHLSDSSAADYVDITSPNTTLYDRNYTLTYSAASAGQTLTVSWVEVTDLGAGNVDLNAAALSIFNGSVATAAGNPQTTVVGTAFATPLQVAVTDNNGRPVSGATVTFSAPTFGATASFSGAASATAVTGSNGLASAPALTANGTAGSYYVTASASGIPATAGFSLTNAAGPPVSILATAGTPANAVVHTVFSTGLQATVTDANNNLVSGTTVTFTAPGVGAGATFAGGTTVTAVTNGSGIAFAPTLTANGQQGSYVVTASVGGGVAPAVYNMTNTAGGVGSLAGSANNSSAAVNLTAVGTSDWIHWGEASPNHKATGASQISTFAYASTMGSNAANSGVANAAATRLHPRNMGFEGYGDDARLMNWSDGTPTAASSNNGDGFYIDYGTYISSGRNGFTFTAPADGTMRTLIVYVGGTISGGTLTAHLSDASAPDFVDTTALASGSYDRNYTLNYTAGAPGQTLTVTWSMTAGNGNVSLSAAALSVGFPATITATAGTPQSTVVNTAFGTALQATALDASNNPLSGVTVTFAAPSSGAAASFGGSATATVTTNSSGIATAPALTANGQVGNYTVNATMAGVSNPAVFSLSNTIGGGSLSGSGNSSSATANLTTEGSADWVHWGDGVLNRKNGVSAQISDYAEVGSGQVSTYNNDPRTLSWTDGTPTASASNSNGVYIFSLNNGFAFTAPADGNRRSLTVHLGGWLSGGTLTAHLSDQSAGDFVDTTAPASGQYDRNYTLTYSAASAGQTLTVSWVMTSGQGNVTLNGAALSGTGPSISATGGTPQSAAVNTAFPAALQATVTDAANNPLSGVTVTFTAPSSGASAKFNGSLTATAVTNAGGVAVAPTLTAYGQAGSYTVTATANGANTPATFSLTNTLGGASLTGAGNSATGSFNLTAEGTADWVHWGGAAPIRKAAGASQISDYTVVGSGPVMNYNNDLRVLTWTDGAPTASGSDSNGVYINALQNGFLFIAPADTNKRALTVHVGGWLSGGTLTAHLSDQSAPDYVDVTLPVNGQYDRNYTLTYTAASAGQTLTVSWVATSGGGNVTLNGAALAASVPSVSATAGTPQTVPVSTAFPVALQATLRDGSNNPLSGVAVTFTAPSTGASATFTSASLNGSLTATVTTNSSGVATAPTLTANSQAGIYSVLATAPGVTVPASFNLTNTSVVAVGGSITGSGNSSAAAVNLSSEGIVDWVHWGDTPLARKAGVSAQIGNYTIVGTGPALNYTNDPRLLNWTDGTPVTASADNNGIYVNALQNGFSFTVPADTNPRTLIVHVGGWVSGGTLTAHISDQSASDYVDVTVPATAQYDRNYTITYTAASAGQTLTLSWVMTSGQGNVTLNAAALSMAGPSITAVAGTPQTGTVNTVFGTALQAMVRDANNNPLSGAMVTFTAPSSGASASFGGSLGAAVATNSSGIATAPALTANAQAGSYTVIASAAGALTTIGFSLTNTLGGASLSGSGSSDAGTVNLTQEGTSDWIHWGVAGLNRKAAVSAQISNYGVVGSGPIMNYTNDPRTLTWSDGTPTAGGSDNEGIYINSSQNGFSFTAPADSTVRTLTVHVGGWFSGGTLTAHLSDISAPDYVDITAQASGQYDRNYTLTYSAASAGQTLTITWVNTSLGGNVTLNGAALR